MRATAGTPKTARARRSKRRTAGHIRFLRWIAAALIVSSCITALYLATSDLISLESGVEADFSSGLASLELGKGALRTAVANEDRAYLGSAQADFVAARQAFDEAARRLQQDPLATTAQRLPLVSSAIHSRFASVNSLVLMGEAISSAASTAVTIEAQLLPVAGQPNGMPQLLASLGQLGPALDKLGADLEMAKRASMQVEQSVLPASAQSAFRKAQASISLAVSGYSAFRRTIPVLQDLFGLSAPRRYLVEQLNTGELRPGGGFIGTYSLIEANRGLLTLVKSGDAYQVDLPRPVKGQPGYVAPPSPFLSLLGSTSWSFVDSNFSVDFMSNAQAAEAFTKQLGQIDGVVAFDTEAVAGFLKVTGPLQVPGLAATVTADNVASLLMQEDLFDPIHKGVVTGIATQLIQRLAQLPGSQMGQLVASLNDLASRRHLQAAFNNSSAEDLMDAYGWSGKVNPAGVDDFAMLVEANVGATKANYWLQRTFTLDLTRSGSTLHHVLTVNYHDAPQSYVRQLDYDAYFRLVLGIRASGLAVSGAAGGGAADVHPPPGYQMIDGRLWVTVPRGGVGSAQLTFAYDTPWMEGDDGSSTLYWQKQPGTAADAVSIRWHGPHGNYASTTDLSRDRLLLLSPGGIRVQPGSAATAALPGLGL